MLSCAWWRPSCLPSTNAYCDGSKRWEIQWRFCWERTLHTRLHNAVFFSPVLQHTGTASFFGFVSNAWLSVLLPNYLISRVLLQQEVRHLKVGGEVPHSSTSWSAVFFIRASSTKKFVQHSGCNLVHEKVKHPHGCASVCSIHVKGEVKVFQELDDRDWFDGVSGVGFHLCGHALLHFCNIFGNRSVKFCRCVRQSVPTVVNCFLEKMNYCVEHFQKLRITASTALMSIRSVHLRAGAKARKRRLGDWHLQAALRMERRWRWAEMLSVLFALFCRAIAALLVILTMDFMPLFPVLGLLVWGCASWGWGGLIRWWRKLLCHFWLCIKLFLD